MLSNGSRFDKNVIIFGVDMNSLVQIDNEKNNFMILDKSSTDGLDDKEYWDTSTPGQVSNCNGVVLKIYLDHIF